MPTKTRQPETFRQWLDRKGLRIQDFVQAIPGMTYGTATKWSMKHPPKKVREFSRLAVAAVYPDCPIAKETI